jgi:zinc transport system substrate-binding protein
MRPIFNTVLAAACMLCATAMSAEALPNVVVSIKPIHSLAMALMKGLGEPELLVDGVASPHTYQMRPSDAVKLQNADIIFWVGHDMEKFMEKPLETLGAKATILELDNVPGLMKLPTRESGAFEPHMDDAPAKAGHDHQETDLHIWLNTDNAKRMAEAMTRTLVQVDPEHAQTYEKNLADLSANLDGLAGEIRQTVAPVKDKPFIVFHDAYQYFERQFGVNVAGSITVSPESMPGAARIREIHDKVKELKSTCVFSEPQFEPQLVNVVLEGTSARTGVLDPEAGGIKKGETLYSDMMLGIAQSLKTCLATGG